MGTERDNEIKHYINSYIRDTLSRYFPNVSIAEKDTYNLSHPCLPYQFWNDEKFAKVYIYYDLDKASKYLADPRKIALTINDRIESNFHKDLNRHPVVVGISQNTSLHSEFLLKDIPSVRTFSEANGSNNEIIRLGTFSYWRCFDGEYRFIQDFTRLAVLTNLFPMVSEDQADIMMYFCGAILEINKKYDFNINTETKVKQAFEEYKEIYKTQFNKDLEPVKDTDITTVYLDLYF